MEIAQEVAQAPAEVNKHLYRALSINSFLKFSFLSFYCYVLMLCAIHMCFIMCKKLCANELIMNQIDYEPFSIDFERRVVGFWGRAG